MSGTFSFQIELSAESNVFQYSKFDLSTKSDCITKKSDSDSSESASICMQSDSDLEVQLHDSSKVHKGVVRMGIKLWYFTYNSEISYENSKTFLPKST